MSNTNQHNKATPYINPKKKRFETKNAALYFFTRRLKLVRRLLRDLKAGSELRRHTLMSRDEYETYDDWEMQIEERGSVRTLIHGRIERVSFRDIRLHYLEPVVAQIQKSIDAGHAPVEVFEVGCGNGTNLMRLKEKFGDNVSLSGIDISPERIRLGKQFWGDKLSGVALGVDSALTLETRPENSCDIVFSIHCLEQLPYHVEQSVAAMARVSSDYVIFVEPVFEYANSTQKMYALFGDQLRTLLPEVEASKLTIVETYPAHTLSNPLNQTGIIIARKLTT